MFASSQFTALEIEFESCFSMFTQLLFNAHLLFCSNVWILLVISFISLLFLHRKNDFQFWERKGVKGPWPLPFVGNSLEQFATPATSLYMKRFKKYGRIYGYYEKSKPVLSIAEPELLRYVMVKDCEIFLNRIVLPSSNSLIKNWLLNLRDGQWKRVRSIISPSFTSRKIKEMTAIINVSIKDLLESLESRMKSNKDIDVKALYGAFTMDVIAACAFATKTNSHSDPNDPFVANANKFVNFKFWRILVAVFIPKFLKNVTRFTTFPGKMIDFFRITTIEIIKQRRNNNGEYHDFMQLLLDAHKLTDLTETIKDINSEQINADNLEETESTAKILNRTIYGEAKLSEDELLAQCVLFFVAAYETTSSLLSFTTYALALNTDCQNLLYNEIKQYYDTEKEFTYEATQKLKYLNAVVNESLRLYTPVIQVNREAKKDYTFPNVINSIPFPLSIPKGSLIHIPLYAIHHDEKNFTEPYLFKPERFLPENINGIKPYTFLPFGCGPRNCIGMRFALMEAKLALCNLILHYKFSKCDKTDIPLKMRKFAVFFNHVENIVLKFEKRI